MSFIEALRIARIALVGEQDKYNITPLQETEAYDRVAEVQNILGQLRGEI